MDLLQVAFANWFPAPLRSIGLLVFGSWLWYATDRFLVSHGVDSLKVFQTNSDVKRKSFFLLPVYFTALYLFFVVLFNFTRSDSASNCFSFFPLFVSISIFGFLLMPVDICCKIERLAFSKYHFIN